MRETWVRKIPWRRERLPTLVFHGQRSLAGYSPRARQESDTTEQLSHTHTHTHTHNLCDKNHTRQNLHFSKKHNGKVCLKRNIWEWWLKHIWEDMYLLLKRSWSGHAGNLNAQWLRKAEITHIPLQWRRGNTCLCPFSSHCFLPILWKYNIFNPTELKKKKNKMQNPSWWYFLSDFLGAYSGSEDHMVHS